MGNNILNKFPKLMEIIKQFAEHLWSSVSTPLTIIFLGSILSGIGVVLSAVGAFKFAIKQEQDSKKNEELQKKINEQSQETLNTITSRGSFGYILLTISKNINGQNGNNAESATVTFVHTGKYPIRNVEISIVNTDEEAQRGGYTKNDFNEDPKQYNKVGFPYRQKVTVLVPKQKIRLPDIPIVHRKQKSFNIFFSAEHDFWFQRIMLRDAAEYGVKEKQPNNQFFSSITQVYKQDLSESRNQVHRWEIIIREGRGWDSGDGYYPEKKSFERKHFPWFPFTEEEGTNVPAGMWMYLHWNGNYLDKEANSIPTYLDQ